MATFLKPFQSYDERDVINLFAYSGAIPANRGTMVKIENSGWAQFAGLDLLGSPGASYANTVSERWGINPHVVPCTSTGDAVIGFLLYDVKETDENGNKLIYNPRKAVELECTLSGQAAPVVTKGIFLYSGISGNPVAGNAVYLAGDGGVTCTGDANHVIGRFLGPKSDQGVALIRFDIDLKV